MNAQIFDTIMRCLEGDMANARDNLYRHELQQKRTPFDHDNNDSVEACKVWVAKTQSALIWMESQRARA